MKANIGWPPKIPTRMLPIVGKLFLKRDQFVISVGYRLNI
jgi:hypothetical protein